MDTRKEASDMTKAENKGRIPPEDIFETLSITNKLIETLSELLSPVITYADPDAAALKEVERRCRMIDGTLLQIELNIKNALDSLSEIGGIAR